MKIILAPDSYKGSLTALEVCQAMAVGIKRLIPGAEIVMVPMADGGEGTVRSLIDTTGGRIITKTVTGPIGDKVESFFGVLGDGRTAVIEMAAASGLPLVPVEKRDPRITTTYGTGELILTALEMGFTKIIVGVGGSATNDGGAGMAQALGYRFLNKEGHQLSLGGITLLELARIDCQNRNPLLERVQVEVACDVTNPLTGPSGASLVYGPQKGATPEMSADLDRALHNFALIVERDLGVSVLNLPGSGSAGGLGAGLIAFLNAQLRPGVKIIVEAVGLTEKLKGADLVLTGEGRIDGQTINGKTPIGVARAAKDIGLPVLAVAGGLGPGVELVYQHGIDGVTAIVDHPMGLGEAMLNAGNLIADATERMLRIYLLGRS
jgi:glycerate 2-kinase